MNGSILTGKRTLGSKGELTLSAITNTHLLLWAVVSPDRLPDATLQLLEDKTHLTNCFSVRPAFGKSLSNGALGVSISRWMHGYCAVDCWTMAIRNWLLPVNTPVLSTACHPSIKIHSTASLSHRRPLRESPC